MKMIFSQLWRNRKIRKSFRECCKALRYRIACDGDILSPEVLTRLRELLTESEEAKKGDISAQEAFLQKAGDAAFQAQNLRGAKWHIRNLLDVLAVAFSVAFGIRALYVQPFKIPTSSMQPTLFGIHYVSRTGLEKFGTPLARKVLPAVSPRAELTVQAPGAPGREYSERTTLLLDTESSFAIGNAVYTLPGNFNSHVLRYVDLSRDHYEAGEKLCDGWLSTGDHLFVERLSLHFRGICRGDVAVFTTEGLMYEDRPLEGFYYIKRVAGMPGDTLRFWNNMLMVRPKGKTKFRPLTELAPAFRKVYSMKGGYHGHLPLGNLEDNGEITVPENCYFMLGDNTSNSLDSRYWGFLPRKNLIGHAWLVFWPFSRRLGIADRLPPLPGKTSLPDSMSWQ